MVRLSQVMIRIPPPHFDYIPSRFKLRYKQLSIDIYLNVYLWTILSSIDSVQF